MTKSQVAAAIALSYIAGGVIAPVSNIYAEAVLTPDCAQSVEMETAGVITGADIERIVSEIQELPIYGAYKNIIDINTKYSAKDENGVSLAALIDQEAADKATAKATADGVLTTAQTNYDNYQANNITSLETMIKQLARSYELDASKTPEEVVAEVSTVVEAYDAYVDIRTKVDAGDLSGAKQAILAFNEAKNGAFANDTALGQMINATDTRTLNSLLNAGGQGMATHYGRLYLEVKNVNAIISALESATSEQADAKAAADAASEKQTKAIAEIIKAAEAIAELGKAARIDARSTLVNTMKFIKEKDAYGGVEDLNLMTDFVNYVEFGAANDDALLAHSTLEGYLSNDEIATEDEKNSIINPVADRKVCDAQGIVAIKGNLPVYHFAVEVAEVSSEHFGFAEKVAYDITLSYKGETYTIDSEVEVVINVPYYIDVDTVEVYHVNGAQLEAMEVAERDAAEGTITFKTTHFSEYALVGERKIDEDFGGSSDDDNFNHDDSFGGNDSSDEGFNVKPVVSVNPNPVESNEEVKLPTVEAPNTGAVVAKTATGKTNATVSIVASMLAIAGAAIAAIVRFVRRDA